MNGENRPIVTDELLAFENQMFDVQDCRKVAKKKILESRDYTSLKLMKTNRKATACEVVVGLGNTRDFQPILSKIIIPKH